MEFFFFLYASNIWSLTLREQHPLRTFENRELRRKVGQKSDKVAGDRRSMLNEELHAKCN
jgi:hypothetical protein